MDEVSKWIKASKRTPENIAPVIITWVNRAIEMEPEIGVAHYCGGKWHWYSSVSDDVLGEYGDSPDAFDDVIEVIAWTPLPRPIRIESEESCNE